MPKVTEQFTFTAKSVRNLPVGVYRDERTPCLFLFKGKTRASWVFRYECRRDGRRIFVSKKLPAVYLDEARKAAEIELGNHRAGKIKHGPRKAVKLDHAMGYTDPKGRGGQHEFAEGSYLRHLADQLAAKGKPATWCREVDLLYGRHVHEKWGSTALADLARRTGAVADWHRALTKAAGPVSANHAARLVRAAYRHAARRSENGLALGDNPVAAVKMNPEKPREIDMSPADFAQWRDDVAAIECECNRAVHVAMLLSGSRPGEISRAKWSGLNVKRRTLTVANGKASNIIIVLSWPIVRALRHARDYARAENRESEFIFPATRGRSHVSRFDGDGLCFHGNALRHAFTTEAASFATAIDLDILTSHMPKGQSAEYVSRLMRERSPQLRATQAKISRRLLTLLGDPGLKCLKSSSLSVRGRTVRGRSRLALAA